MIRIYTFTIDPPAGVDPLAAGPLMTQHLDRMAAASKELLESVIEATDDGRLIVSLTYQGRDRWYIHKKIKFPLVAALRRVGMKVEHVKSTQVSVPVSGRDRPTPRMPPPLDWEPLQGRVEGRDEDAEYPERQPGRDEVDAGADHVEGGCGKADKRQD